MQREISREIRGGLVGPEDHETFNELHEYAESMIETINERAEKLKAAAKPF